MIFAQFENISKASIEKDLARIPKKTIKDKFTRLDNQLKQLKENWEFWSYEQEALWDIQATVNSIELDIL